MYEMLGMNLLKLLSQNRIMDFHIELELFVHSNTEKALNDPYIKKAVEIEQYLTEGRYNKVNSRFINLFMYLVVPYAFR